MQRGVIIVLLLILAGISAVSQAVAATEIKKVALITNRLVLSAKVELLQQAATAQQISLVLIEHESLSEQQLITELAQYQMLLVDLPRANDFSQMLSQLQPVQVRLPKNQLWVGRTEKLSQGLNKQDAEQLWQYYRHGGKANFQHFFQYMAALNQPELLASIAPPVALPTSGAYHPRFEGLFTADLTEMQQFLQKHKKVRGTIAIGFHARYLESAAMQHIDAIITAVEQRGLTALAVFYTLGPEANLSQLLKGKADVLLHLQPVYHNGLLPQLEQLRIPVLQGIGWWQGDKQHWLKDPVGISLAGTPLYLALPEQNGLVDPLVLWAEHEGVIQPIPEQINAMVNKASALIALQQNSGPFAVMVYNYPPGERNIAASFMNVPRSLANLSELWAKAGLNIPVFTEQQAIDQLGTILTATQDPAKLKQLVAQRQASFLPLEDYLNWYQQLPEPVRLRIEQHWGKPEQSGYIQQLDKQTGFIIPHWHQGDLLILAQPPRGEPGTERERSLYHDLRVPVNHYYLASYLWLRAHSTAKALVHFGTHGTQEWMPGKERGLSVFDDPLLAIGDIPVIYPYIVDNVGEATQAKRRGRAQMISHQTPPFRPTGLHGKLIEMHQLIHQYEQLEPGDVRQFTQQRLIELVLGDPIMHDLGWDERRIQADFANFLLHIHDYLHELAAMAQPLGLHTFASGGIDEQRLTTVLQMLGDEFLQALAVAQPEELYAADYQTLSQTVPYQWLQHVLSQQTVTPELPEWQEKALHYYDLLNANQEFSGLQTGLSGGYVSPSVGGDPLRVLDSLPTGRNLYGFDPTKIPTRQAWQAGKAAVDELISVHQQQHGSAPKKLAFSLWAVETMRHGGVLESQALFAMGVEPQWDRAGRVTGYRIIPTSELARPRIDVVLSATGLYRDQFPNMMAHFAKATAELSALDEAENQLYQHSQALAARLQQAGRSKAEANTMAAVRVFGSPTGVYGTGLDDAIAASDTWDDDNKLAQLYLSRMSYAFGAEPEQWGQGEDYSELYAEQLKDVDAALLARTSNLYGMLTTDDPFQYLGGIDLAVRHLTGKSPALYISNQRQAGKAKIEAADRFLATELNSRSFHPGWVSAMMEEGFAGALNMQDTLANFWGWQVASPDIVRADQWQRFHDIYVMDSLDLDINEWFSEHAPEAQLKMQEQMLEAIRKDYWQADDTTLKQLLEAYIERLNELSRQPGHDKLRDFVQSKASGFGLQGPLAGGEAAAQVVSGQQLVQKTATEAMDNPWWFLPLLLLIPLMFGVYRQFTSRSISYVSH